MDTTATPEFKIAKVGKDRKRKGGGLPFFSGGSGGGGAFSGAVGGSGAAAGAGLIGKIGVLALISTLSAGAWQAGKSLRADEAAAVEKPKIFASNESSYSESDLANVIRSNNSSIPNSMGYVKGSLDGMTAEERAKKEAEAAEAARLAEEEAKKAEADAAAKEPSAVAGVPAGVDPNAVMKGVGDEKKEGAFGKKFGALSSSFGGGLAGGSGLAGGVNRGFSNVALKTKGSGGKMSAMRGGSNPSMTKGTPARGGGGSNKGFARRQLNNAFALSRQANTAGKGESSAQAASSAFDNNNGAGNVITGPGVGAGTGGAGLDAGASVNPNTGGAINSGDNSAPMQDVKGVNVTKWQDLMDMAQALLLAMTVLGLLALVLEKTGYGAALLPIIYGAIVALGAIVTMLGIAIMAMGQYLQGGVLTAIGALSTYLAYQQLTAVPDAAAKAAAPQAGQLIDKVLPRTPPTVMMA